MLINQRVYFNGMLYLWVQFWYNIISEGTILEKKLIWWYASTKSLRTPAVTKNLVILKRIPEVWGLNKLECVVVCDFG